MTCRLSVTKRKPTTRLAGPPTRVVPLAAVAALAAAALSGCAHARVDTVAETTSGPQPPAAILVDARPAAADSQPSPAAASAAEALEKDVITRLEKAGLAAGPRVSEQVPAEDAVLHVTVQQANPGNSAERLIIGLGAGRSVLHVNATLDFPAHEGQVLQFNASADSGRKPGLILPGAVAAATGNAIHLAIGGGLDLLWTSRSGLDGDASKTATAIVGRLKTYYQTAGWSWPNDHT